MAKIDQSYPTFDLQQRKAKKNYNKLIIESGYSSFDLCVCQKLFLLW